MQNCCSQSKQDLADAMSQTGQRGRAAASDGKPDNDGAWTKTPGASEGETLVVAGAEVGRLPEEAPAGNSACARPGRSSRREKVGRTMDNDG